MARTSQKDMLAAMLAELQKVSSRLDKLENGQVKEEINDDGPAKPLNVPQPRQRETPAARWQAGKKPWVDDGKTAIKDRSFPPCARTTERRDEFTGVAVTCRGCNRQFMVSPQLLSPRLDKDDDQPRYICDSCLRAAVPQM